MRHTAAGPAKGTVAVNPGGPGEVAIDRAPLFAPALHGLLADHDLLLVDPRGTGRSERLPCGVTDAEYRFGTRAQQRAAVERCARNLGPKAAAYTAATADDTLPVTPEALRVARTGRGEHRADVVVSGTEYGTLTRALPGGGAVTAGQSYDDVARVDDAFLWRISWTTAAAVALSALLSWWVLGRILRPLRELARATGRITATQDLSTGFPPAGSDEIGR